MSPRFRRGWRCPDYRVSPQTLDILSDEGFLWDSSTLNDDLPSRWDCTGGSMIEIPFTTATADKTYVASQFNGNQYFFGNPRQYGVRVSADF